MLCIFAGCYSPPRPDCGFLCGAQGACPTDYHCAADGICHLDGTPANLNCGRDAGVDARIPDTQIGDFTPPQVTLIVPGDEMTSVPLTTTVKAGFDEDVLNTTAGMSLRYGPMGGEDVPGAVVYDATLHVATLTPNAPLVGNIQHTATLSTIITDLAGNALTMPVTWSFTRVPDGVAPTVTVTSPRGGATAVPVASPIEVTFNEPIKFFNAANVAVSASATPISGTFGTTGPRTMVFTPDADLPAGSTIDVTLATGIVDYSGNPLATTTFSFATQ